MLKKLLAFGVCACLFTACGELDLTDPADVRKHFENQQIPMTPDRFVSFAAKSDTANMALFIIGLNKDIIDATNVGGNNALALATNKNNVVVVQFLLKRGANLHIKSQSLGTIPIEDAAIGNPATQSDRRDVLKLLIEAHKKEDPELGNTGSAVWFAARDGVVETVEILGEAGVPLNAKNAENSTPLHEAAKAGRLAVTEYLISKRVDINPKDKDGYTPMDWAEATGPGTPYPKVAAVLKKVGGVHTPEYRKAL